MEQTQVDEDEDEEDGFVTFSSRLVRSVERQGNPTVLCAHSLSPSQFPNLKAVGNSGSLPLGALFTPFSAPVGAPPPVVHRTPVRCPTCGAFANRFCEVDGRNGRWRCLFCQAASFCREYVGERGDRAELTSQAVDYLLVSHPQGALPTPQPLCHAFVLDETLDAGQLRDAVASLQAALAALPGDAAVALLLAGACVSVLHLGCPGSTAQQQQLCAESTVFPSDGTAAEALLAAARARGALLCAPLTACRGALQAALGSLRPHRPAGAGAASRPRALGAAVDLALRLLRSHMDAGDADAADWEASEDPWAQALLRGRVAVLAAGPPNVGLGATSSPADAASDHPQGDSEACSFWAQLGASACACGVAVDLFSAGALPLGLRAMLPLARASGGCCVLCGDGGFGARGAGAALASSLSRAHSAAAGVDVRLSPGLGLRRVVGAVRALPPGAALAAPLRRDESGGPAAPDSLHALALHPADGTACVACYLSLEEDTPARWAYFQFVARSVRTRADGACRLRVVTRRLRCTPDGGAYADALRCDVAAVLAAKAEAADLLGGAAAALDGGDAAGRRVQHAAGRHGCAATPHARRWGGAAAVLGPGLGGFARRLYHCGRGPLAPSAHGAALEGALAAAHALLTAPPCVAVPLVSPALYRLALVESEEALAVAVAAAAAAAAPPPGWEGRTAPPAEAVLSRLLELKLLAAVPAVDLALDSDALLLLDAGLELTAWLGARLAQQPQRCERATRLAEALGRALAVGRCPPPPLLVTLEGASQARRLTVRRRLRPRRRVL